MKKRIFYVLIVGFIFALFCGRNSQAEASSVYNTRFITISNESIMTKDFYIRGAVVCDSETYVEYYISSDGKLTPLLDTDGSPLLYTREE